jgi:hypothetical protein
MVKYEELEHMSTEEDVLVERLLMSGDKEMNILGMRIFREKFPFDPWISHREKDDPEDFIHIIQAQFRVYKRRKLCSPETRRCQS